MKYVCLRRYLWSVVYYEGKVHENPKTLCTHYNVRTTATCHAVSLIDFSDFLFVLTRLFMIVACTILCPTIMKSRPGYSMSKPQSTNRSNSQRQTSQTQTCRKKVAIKKYMVHGIEPAVIVHANIKTFFQRVDFRENFNNRGNFALGLSAGSKYFIGDNQMRVAKTGNKNSTPLNCHTMKCFGLLAQLCVRYL